MLHKIISFFSKKTSTPTSSPMEEDFRLARQAEARALARAAEMRAYVQSLKAEADKAEAEAKQAEESRQRTLAEKNLAEYALSRAVRISERVAVVATKREAKAEREYMERMEALQEVEALRKEKFDQEMVEYREKRAQLRARLQNK